MSSLFLNVHALKLAFGGSVAGKVLHNEEGAMRQAQHSQDDSRRHLAGREKPGSKGPDFTIPLIEHSGKSQTAGTERSVAARA